MPRDSSLPPLRLFVMRHGRSVSNMIRDPRRLGRPPTQQEIEESQNVRDPRLTEFGEEACEWYRTVLPARLRRLGFDTHSCVLGSSRLLRAQETAELIFPFKDLVVFDALGENSDVPENTPRGMRYRRPSWARFLDDLNALASSEGASDFVVVAHGSFLMKSISKILGEDVPYLDNLDGYALELRRNKKGALTREGAVVHLPFPVKAYEGARSDEPAFLHAWRVLFHGRASSEA